MSRTPIAPPTLAAIRAAAERLRGLALRTPLIPLELPECRHEIYLKPENLQPIGSFKVRGAGNAMLLAGEERLADGVYTASAGNMAQGVAWAARRLGVPCRVIVPEHAPKTKLKAIDRLGGEAIKVPFDDWWRVIVEHRHPGIEGHFIHPVAEPAVIAGNATIGLEIAADLPAVKTILVPFGGGGLSCGIAAAARAVVPAARVYACEVATAAPLAAALAAGKPVAIDYAPSFVDGIGGKNVLDEMWPVARRLLAGSLVVGLEEVAAALRLLALRARLVAEGAGATPLAAALANPELEGPVVCVVSGGNLDADKLIPILGGALP
ncbi:MAG: pyridoxal-phosphate dependent enzyme [Acidobacteria bacterium]|nr:MAG: pyridoxal-phosphate dependent enzyme [Acidobacteriota bacterium]